MASFLSSMVMCVALGIPSPSKNPSLVNSSCAAGEQLGSLSAFASVSLGSAGLDPSLKGIITGSPGTLGLSTYLGFLTGPGDFLFALDCVR